MHPLDFKKERLAYVMLHMLDDILVTSWKAVLPDMLLQSRLLRCLRAELVTVADNVCISFTAADS